MYKILYGTEPAGNCSSVVLQKYLKRKQNTKKVDSRAWHELHLVGARIPSDLRSDTRGKTGTFPSNMVNSNVSIE